MDCTRFLEGLVDVVGGAAETEGGTLRLLAPPSTGLPELAEFALTPEGEGEPLHLGHPYLEAAIEVARGQGQVAWRHSPEARLTRPGVEQLLRETLAFRNARLDLGRPQRTCLPWALFHFRVTAVYDEKRELLATVGLDLQSGARLPAGVLKKVWLEEGPGPEPAPLEGLTLAYERARAALPQELEGPARAFSREAERQLSVELARLEDYYREVLADLERRLAGASAERRPSLAAKLEQTRKDRQLRRTDLEQKLRLRWTARLACLELVAVPRMVVPAQLTCKGASRTLLLSYNFLTHQPDPVLCQVCHRQEKVWWLCREGHLACPSCHQECSGCRKVRCPLCPSRTCAGCGEPGCPCRPRCERCAAEPAPPPPAPVAPAQVAAGPTPVAAAPEPSREGLVIRAFASHLRVYRDLREELLSPDRLVARGQTREAGQQLQALARDVRADCGTLRQELREAGKALVSLWPQKALAHLERLAEQNVAVVSPFEQQVRQVLAEEEESTVEETLMLYERCRLLHKQGQRPEGWLAACFYLASFNSAAGAVGQASAGEVFGVSGATVSQRARAIQDYLPDTRPRRGWGAW